MTYDWFNKLILLFFLTPYFLKCDAQAWAAPLVSEPIYHVYYTPELEMVIPHLILHSQCLYHFNVWPFKPIRVLNSESERITMKYPIHILS